MTTMMDWEETSPSPGGSASGSSLNGHSEAEDDTIGYHRTTNHITTLNLKLNNNNSQICFGDKKPNIYSYFPVKENPLLLNDGFNGLNLNPSPPAPVGQDLSISSSTTNLHSLPRSPNHSASKGGQNVTSNTSPGVSGSGTSKTSPSTTTGKRNKPIPPPLDLSIGASSLNSSASSSSSTGSGVFQYPGTFYSPYYHLGSPKFNQAEKTLPLRKRWHSWSPKLMNCQEDLIPLYADPAVASSTNGSAAGREGTNSNGIGPSNSKNSSGTKNNGSLLPPSYAVYGGRGGLGPSGNGNCTPQSAGLQTPTPFYTPNEPSPRFMNSPVFSYSTPDTNLYQGPYSPIRTTTLYPPGSPYLNSSLNTPTFVITNLSPPTTSSASTTITVTMGASSSGSNSSSTSSSSSVPGPSVSSVILGPTPSFNSPFPVTILSPASSQASSNHSYDESQDIKYSNGHNFLVPSPPVWNIFVSGTKVRFISDSGQTTGWYLTDYLGQLNDLSVILGFGIKGEFAPHGLSVKQYVVTSSARERVQITFTPANNDHLHHPNIEADCEAGHPFMVMKKGVCAVKPEGFTQTYGSHCMKLEMLDVCLNLNLGVGPKQSQIQQHHQPSSVFSSNGICSTVPSPLRNGHGGSMTTPNNSMSRHFIPSQFLHQQLDDIRPTFGDIKHNFMPDIKGGFMEDIKPFAHPIPLSAIPTSHHSQLSHSHHQLDHHIHIKQENFGGHMETEPSLPIHNGCGIRKTTIPKTKTKIKKNKESNNNIVSSTVPNSQGEPKGRRPMNAFLVYAKERRPLLIQMYPGKDNRSISTLLGDSWKNLDPEEKSYYIKTAKDSADEQKKLHPDCWKRKRSQQPATPNPPKMEVLTQVS